MWYSTLKAGQLMKLGDGVSQTKGTGPDLLPGLPLHLSYMPSLDFGNQLLRHHQQLGPGKWLCHYMELLSKFFRF